MSCVWMAAVATAATTRILLKYLDENNIGVKGLVHRIQWISIVLQSSTFQVTWTKMRNEETLKFPKIVQQIMVDHRIECMFVLLWLRNL